MLAIRTCRMVPVSIRHHTRVYDCVSSPSCVPSEHYEKRHIHKRRKMVAINLSSYLIKDFEVLFCLLLFIMIS